MYMDCTYLLGYLFEKYDTDGGLSNTFLIIDNWLDEFLMNIVFV